jgi:exodeoxyribonuclease VII large subunit
MGAESRIACAIFKQYAGVIPKWPENGDSVLAEGSVGIYPQRGSYQLYARRLVPVGDGAIERARRELKERLEKEGLFAQELKRALPPYPKKVALITSPTGAAVMDVIQVARRRFPACAIVVIGTQVQGTEAPAEIVLAFSRVAATPGLDCVLLARGGGSREDLVPFDDEAVVRAVRSCPVPVVTGVGHEINTTLCDMAADLRASTPSAAAELVFPDRAELEQALLGIKYQMERGVRKRIAEFRSGLSRAQSLAVSRARQCLRSSAASFSALRGRLRSDVKVKTAAARGALDVRAAALDALSPLAVMTRGFAVCERDGKRIRYAAVLSEGDCVKVRFSDGGVEAKVKKTKKVGDAV